MRNKAVSGKTVTTIIWLIIDLDSTKIIVTICSTFCSSVPINLQSATTFSAAPFIGVITVDRLPPASPALFLFFSFLAASYSTSFVQCTFRVSYSHLD